MHIDDLLPENQQKMNIQKPGSKNHNYAMISCEYPLVSKQMSNLGQLLIIAGFWRVSAGAHGGKQQLLGDWKNITNIMQKKDSQSPKLL